MKLNDIETIVIGCIKGSKRSQMELYDRCSQDVFLTAYRIVQLKDEAEDITQNSFLKIFDRIDRYRNSPKSVIYALKRIAINASIDFVRGRRVKFIDDISNIPDLCEDSVDYEDVDIKVAAIKNAINELPNGARMIVTLRIIEEYSFEDIAEQLQMKSSTVRTQYVRAKRKILTLLNYDK